MTCWGRSEFSTSWGSISGHFISEPAELSAGSGVLRTLYALTVTFVEPSPVVHEALNQICGPADDTGDEADERTR